MRISEGKSMGDREEINGQRENAFSVLNVINKTEIIFFGNEHETLAV